MDVVFLDANVLFSAAYKHEANFMKLWRLPGLRLISSAYAAEEARRNLDQSEQRKHLQSLLEFVELAPASPPATLPEGVDLPAKDAPILLCAIQAGATHLLTGDVTHFGQYYGKSIGGVMILSPAAYFLARSL